MIMTPALDLRALQKPGSIYYAWAERKLMTLMHDLMTSMVVML